MNNGNENYPYGPETQYPQQPGQDNQPPYQPNQTAYPQQQSLYGQVPPYQQQAPYGQQPYGQQPYGQMQSYQQPYGQAQPYRQAYPQRPQLRQGRGPGSGQAVTGMVMTVISIPLAIASGIFFWLGIYALIADAAALVLAIVGITLSASGGTKNMRAGYVRGGASIAGIVCGIIGIVLATVMFTCTGCTTIAYCNGASFQRTVNGFKIR